MIRRNYSPRVGRRKEHRIRTRYLLPVNPSYVIIGLSLANEGIFEAKTKDDKDAVFQQYADGIRSLISKARLQNIVPIVTLCYPRLVYTPIEYEYIRRINILQNSWDVPTVNFLGALDDGNGRWARGFMFNDMHPNASGHQELALTFVPTLFEALEKGKVTPSKPAVARGFARISAASAPLTFTPDSTMHPFAFSMTVRTQGSGALAAISGSALAAKRSRSDRTLGPSPVEFEEAVLNVDRPFTSTIGVENGKWAYTSADGTRVTSSAAADEQWHHIMLSHYTRGAKLFSSSTENWRALWGTSRTEPVRDRRSGFRERHGGSEGSRLQGCVPLPLGVEPGRSRYPQSGQDAPSEPGGLRASGRHAVSARLDRGEPGAEYTGLKIGSGRIVHVDDNVRQTR